MKKSVFASVLGALVLMITCSDSFASEDVTNIGTDNEPGILDNLGSNTFNSFFSPVGALHLAAFGSTYGLSQSGVDYRVHNYFSKHGEYHPAMAPAAFIGYTLPVLASAPLYLYGRINNDRSILGAGCAVIQANMIALGYSTALKAATGRPHPGDNRNEDKKELSREFRFGFMRGGVDWGWPSGHTIVSMTTVMTLATYYPDNIWIKAVGYPFVGYMMVSMFGSHEGKMHWFSDTIAGALMGIAIGYTVGDSYHDSVFGGPKQSGGLSVSPILGYREYGLSLTYVY